RAAWRERGPARGTRIAASAENGGVAGDLGHRIRATPQGPRRDQEHRSEVLAAGKKNQGQERRGTPERAGNTGQSEAHPERETGSRPSRAREEIGRAPCRGRG